MRSARDASAEFAAAVVQAPKVKTVTDLVDALERGGLRLAVGDDDRLALGYGRAARGGQSFAGLLGRLRAGQRGRVCVEIRDVTHGTEVTDDARPLTWHLAAGSKGLRPL